MKITRREKGETRRATRPLSPPRLAFLVWGDFHAPLRFARSTIPEKNERLLAATCGGDTSQRQNRFVCTGFFWGGNLRLQHNFVAVSWRKQSNLTIIAATKFFGRDKDFHKNFSVHAKRFVTAMCRRVAVNSRPTYAHGVICRCNVLLQLVARPVHTEWYVVSTCCCNLSPDLYTLSDKSPRLVASTCRPTCTHGVICGLGLLLQLVARPVHTERYVASTCCCNKSPFVVYWPKSEEHIG